MSEGHPTPFDLEASHAEGRLLALEPHLAGCSACRATLDRLESDRTAFLAARPAAPFVRQIRQRLDAEQHRAGMTRWWVLQLMPLGALLAAFALLQLRPLSEVPAASVKAAAPEEPAKPGLGSPQPGSVLHEASPARSSELVVKGGGGPALIVRRDSSQFIARGIVTVHPGDELRLRFELTQPGLVEAGILMPGGDWAPFFSGHFAAGQHTPPATLRVDDQPSTGTLMLGAPAEVSRARAGSSALVQTLSIEWKPSR